MELKKGSSHDFDVLAENKGLITPQDSEGGLTLVLQKFSPYPITVVIIPALGKARVQFYYRELEQSIVMEIPLAILRTQELDFSWALGILKQQDDISIEIPLARTLQAVCLLLEQPLKISPIKLKIAVSDTGKTTFGIEWKGRFGRTRKETVKTLKALLKLLKEGD